MRIIKLRAWDKINLRMLQVVRFCWDTPIQILVDEKNRIYEIHQYNLEIMQFIGLRDNKRTKQYLKGQEIYDGDIVNNHDKVGQVRWNTSGCEFYVYGMDGKLIDYQLNSDWEVIGNIYENPELLKGEIK